MACALVSLIAGIPVRHDVAMTGELTLRGKVLPIGGLKEKLLAAARAGITTAIIPAANAPELSEIPAHVTAKLTVKPVRTMDEVLDIALVGSLAAAKKPAGGEAAHKTAEPARAANHLPPRHAPKGRTLTLTLSRKRERGQIRPPSPAKAERASHSPTPVLREMAG
jgi:ATP-dependent Lon protease